MADSGQQVSSMPLPPMQYVNQFTDENVKRGRAPKPPPPMKDNYTMFGVTFSADDQIIRPLENQGLRRLYPQHYDHKRELKKLNHSILINFLDLIDILIKAPECQRRVEKIDDLTLLFIHMHHLINEFRPHQARETLRVLLKIQKHERLETAERFQKHLQQVEELVRSSLASLPDDSALDTKLVIKQEPTGGDGEEGAGANGMEEEDGGEVGLPAPPKKIKTEPGTDEFTGMEEIDILDRMMCDIVDKMN